MTWILRRLWSWLWLAVAVAVIGAAVFISSVRMLLAFVPDYRAQIEQWAAAALDRPVEIQRVDAFWWGLAPVMELEGVTLMSRDGSQRLLRLKRVEIGVDLLGSIDASRLEPSHVSVVGAELTVERRPGGGLRLEGFEVASPDRVEQIALWLFSQSELNLRDSAVVWRPGDGSGYTFRDVDVTLRNDGGHHQLSGTLSLPARLGGEARIALDIIGDPLLPMTWTGRGHVAAGRLELGGWSDALPGLEVGAGKGRVALWSQWEAGRPRGFHADVDLSGLRLARADASERRLALGRLAGRAAWRWAEDDGWRLAVDRFTLERDGPSWPVGALGVTVGAHGTPVSVDARYLDLADVAAMARFALPRRDALARALGELAPRGRVQDLALRVAPGAPRGRMLALDARFDDLAFAPPSGLPGIQGVDGHVQGDDAGGRVVLDARDVGLDYPRLFRSGLSARRATGAVTWRRGPGEWRIAADDLRVGGPDLEARGRFRLTGGDGRAPFLDLRADVADGDVARAPHYLPARVMPDKVVGWLDRALASGQITDGGVIFHGPADAFPFDGGEGRFQARLALAGMRLDYKRGWPVIEDGDAELVLDGRSMTVSEASGRVFGVDIDEAHARIPDLAHAELAVEGRARGPANDMLRYLARIREEAPHGPLLAELSGEGTARLDLGLRLPLGGGEPSVEGTVTLEDNAVAMPRWGMRLESLEGRVGFTRESYRAEGVRGRFLGSPVRLNVGTQRVDGGPVHRLDAAGELPLARMPGIGPAVADHIDGLAQTRLRLTWPQDLSGSRRARLTLASGLEGVSVDLPAPLGKDREERRLFRLVCPLSIDGPGAIELSYGEDVNTLIALETGSGSPARMAVHLGAGGAPSLPEEPVTRVTGRLRHVRLAEWQALRDGTAGGPPLELDLEVGTLEAYGQSLHEATLEVRESADAWAIGLDSREVAGRIEAPTGTGRRGPLTAELERCHLAPPDGASRLDDPRDLPPLSLRCDDLRYGEREIGRVRLLTEPRMDGLTIERFNVDSSALSGELSGSWRVTPGGRDVTSLEGSISSGDVRKALSMLGFAAGVRAEEGLAELSLGWSGPPTGFDAGSLNGELSLTLRDGGLEKVEPGAGRVFGLLSLQALPRRLTLDFSDVFSKGLSFDTIAGRFQLVDGDAFTDNLVMEGPSVYMEAKGRIGIAEQVYDQRVTVVPHVSSTLPIAGALAGGPGVGAVLYLTQRLFKSEIEKLTQYHYRVTGPWSDPTVERTDEDGVESP